VTVAACYRAGVKSNQFEPRPGVWDVTTVFTQDGKVLREQTFVRELIDDRYSKLPSWLLVERASQGVASTRMAPDDFAVLSHVGTNPGLVPASRLQGSTSEGS